MAKSKVEAGAERAEIIAEAIEGAIAAWSPIAAKLVKGVRLLVKKARGGEVTEAEVAQAEADIAESEAILDEMSARGADYRRRREAEKASGGE